MSDTAHRVVYGSNRFPKQPAPGLCRGCHAPVPKGRTTWCSKLCYKTYDPKQVQYAVGRRDKYMCQICGDNLSETYWRKQKPVHPEDACATEVEYAAYMANRDSPERLAALAQYNEAHKAWWKARPRIEYDHIIPFSEGGLTLVENMRVLCRKCHKARTATWRAEKAAQRRLERA